MACALGAWVEGMQGPRDGVTELMGCDAPLRCDSLSRLCGCRPNSEQFSLVPQRIYASIPLVAFYRGGGQGRRHCLSWNASNRELPARARHRRTWCGHWQTQFEAGKRYRLFLPILDLELDDVWDAVFLPPHPKAINAPLLERLHRGASGECPIVKSPQAPPCASGFAPDRSSRDCYACPHGRSEEHWLWHSIASGEADSPLCSCSPA